MQKLKAYLGWILAGLVILAVVIGMTSCRSESKQNRRIEEKQVLAERQTAVLCEALERGASIDTIRAITESTDEVFFYVFDAHQMVYWSSNRLASGDVFLHSYDTWRDKDFANAKTKVRWTRAGMYNVLTVIPISYTELQDYTEIYTVAAQTFSFRQLLEYEDKPYASSRPYFILCHVLFGLIILIGIIILIHYRGTRNMRLSTRIMYIVMVPVLAVFIYIFFMSIRYVHANQEEHQRHDLQMRSEYVQSYLRNL